MTTAPTEAAPAKVLSEPDALISWFSELGLQLERIGLEAGPLSQWLHAAMKTAGLAVELIETSVISSKIAKTVFEHMVAGEGDPAAIVETYGLVQVTDTGAIEAICKQVMDANPKAVGEYKAGKLGSINFLKGQVLKISQGRANPQGVNDTLAKLLA